MPLPAPKLDDRSFQDLVDEAKKRIPRYCKEWTDHNVSDPGVTLIELFAWMTDVLLYRVNQVPDLHYIKFMDMLGIRLHGPEPAKAPVTFWLAAPQPNDMLIPAGTEVSSTQTETEKPIVFSTDRELKIQPPQLSKIYSRISGGEEGKKAFKEQNIRRLEAGFEGFEVFTSVPQVDDALYFGFENNISQHILGFEMDWDPAGGAGIDPTLPPYLWEASTGAEGERWAHCEVEMDQSKGLNVAGRIQIHLPQMGKYDVKGNSLYWVRLRVIPLTPEMEREGARPYRLSPRLRKAVAASWGGTVAATHSQTITREFLGQSNGSPGQRFQLKYIPILDRLAQETLVVQVDGEAPQPWKEVSDFSDSWAHDPHFTLDSTSGEVRLGPAVRQPDGTIKMYGDVPARGANLIFESYRYGGGQEGNVQPGILNTLKTAIPFIGRVRNRFPASGGMDSESLEAAMMRAPALLRSRQRAVTEADYEFLARQALPSAIGRVKCLQPSPSEAGKILPGQVFVLVIPRLNQPEGFLDPELLKLEDKHIKALSAYLNERRLLTCRLDIRPPAYQWVAVKVRLRPSPGADPGKVKQDVLSRLYHYLNPLTGGPDGKGWPFGREVFSSDIYQCLQGIPHVQFVRSMEMFSAKPGAEAQGSPLETIEVVSHGVIASGTHQVEFV